MTKPRRALAAASVLLTLFVSAGPATAAEPSGITDTTSHSVRRMSDAMGNALTLFNRYAQETIRDGQAAAGNSL
ncbi:hypothetical protein [Streptomyces sp. URMC 123]|uniref:hypothetical protein n=1 Tax=Streptomyces sp. URMC 123 TaxID=3423403 RepID=UPI003F1AF999